uniref:Homeobox domain-containing protein n=1 Tax=Leptobrachium leishanense TaxID=445787 RepID=A0A8C5WMM6_9ANUR
ITHRLSRRNLPRRSVNILLEWLRDHCEFPYPDESDKTDLKMKTGLTYTQVNNWFINARRRVLSKIARRKQMLLTVSNKMGGKKYKSIPDPSKKTVKVDTLPSRLNIVAAVLLHFAPPPSLALVTNFGHGLHPMKTEEDNIDHGLHLKKTEDNIDHAVNESPAPSEEEAAEEKAAAEQFTLTKLPLNGPPLLNRLLQIETGICSLHKIACQE